MSLYGLHNYGDGYYSATKYVDASATASVAAGVSAVGQRIHLTSSVIANAATVTSACERIKLALAQKAASSSVTANANFTTNASASTAGQTAIGTDGVRIQFVSSIIVPASVTVASCERVRPTSAQTIVGESYIAPVNDVVTAGGSADISMTSASTASGVRVREADSTATPAASTQSAGQIIKLGVSNPQAASTNTAAGTRVRLADSVIAANETMAANGQITANTGGSLAGASSLTSTCNRVQFSSGALGSTTVIVTIGREKWEPISYTPVTWSEIAA